MRVDRDIESAPGRNVIAVIGIDRYRGWPALHNAVADASGTRRLFQQLGFEELTPPLLDDQATGQAIHALVTDDLMALGADDRLVLFYAGHGSTRVRQLANRQIKTGYLIPCDASSARDKVASWIDLDGWLRKVSLLPARHILVILDACHSGIALEPVIRWRDTGSWKDAPLATLAARQSRRVITSALDDQVACDSGPVHGHSLFTGCLIEGLTHGLVRDARHFTTGSELGLYVQQRVQTYPGSRQTPDFGTFDFDDRGELPIPLAIEPTAQAVPAMPPPMPRRRTPRSSKARMTGPEIAELREAILEAFDKSEFDRFLFDHFDYDRARAVGDGGLRDIVDLVLRDFVRQGRSAALIDKVAEVRPHDLTIQEIHAKHLGH